MQKPSGPTQRLETFLAGTDISLRRRELTLIADPWRTKQYLCELHGTNGDEPITGIVGSDDGPPQLPEVLDIVAAEAATIEETRRFEEWATRMGYDPGSRYVEREYRTERRRAKLLRQMLGDEAYEKLLWLTERL
jgi:hypothetical protein